MMSGSMSWSSIFFKFGKNLLVHCNDDTCPHPRVVLVILRSTAQGKILLAFKRFDGCPAFEFVNGIVDGVEVFMVLVFKTRGLSDVCVSTSSLSGVSSSLMTGVLVASSLSFTKRIGV